MAPPRQMVVQPVMLARDFQVSEKCNGSQFWHHCTYCLAAYNSPGDMHEDAPSEPVKIRGSKEALEKHLRECQYAAQSSLPESDISNSRLGPSSSNINISKSTNSKKRQRHSSILSYCPPVIDDSTKQQWHRLVLEFGAYAASTRSSSAYRSNA